jgi:hypothetical protein
MRRTPLPADPATVAAFLTEAAPRLSAGALARRASAIAAQHRAPSIRSHCLGHFKHG